MQILLVDDQPAKLRAAIEFLVSDCGVPRDEIVVAHTGWACRTELRTNRFDLMILDVLLPLREEDDPDARTALGILEDIHEGRGLKQPRHIVGLSALESLPSEAAEAFRARTWTVVRYDPTTNAWKGPLRNLLDYIRRASEKAESLGYQTDVCTLTALDIPEMEQIHRLPCCWEDAMPLDDHTFIRKGSLSSGGRSFSLVSACAPRMGMVATALLAAKLIDALRPRFIVMAGICAGVDGKAKIGDVLLADPSWNWQSGKHLSSELGPHFAAAPHQLDVPEFIRARGAALRADVGLLAGIKKAYNGVRPAHDLDLIVGPVASGSAVLADETMVQQVKSQERALVGVEMEIYGVYAAAAFAGCPRPTAFAMKAVCDFGSKGKNDDHQVYAAYSSAAVLYAFLERYLSEIFDFAGT